MSKKNILNLLLLMAVAALASAIYFTEMPSSELQILTRTNADNITTLSINRNGNVTTFNKQADGHWQITQPLNIAANDFRIASILKLLAAPVHKRYRASEIDTQTIGLEEAETIISFNNIKISFGITNPVTTLRFVRIGEAVSTIQDVYLPLVNSHFSTLVSLNLVPLSAQPFSGIEKLILLNQTISKDDKDLWQSNIDITADNINKTLDHWQHDQAFGVHQYLERKQLGEVFIYTKNSDKVISYQITDTDPWLILARPEIGLEYHLDIEAFDKLISPQ